MLLAAKARRMETNWPLLEPTLQPAAQAARVNREISTDRTSAATARSAVP
jgi:hypothetical protein